VKYKLFKLKFVSPLHIGTNRPGFESSDEILHSDTLFSALVNCWSQLYPDDLNLFFPKEAKSLVIPFFAISSAFPYMKERLYFPKPYLPLDIPKEITEANPNLSKKLKSITYFSQTLFEKVISNEEIRISTDWISADGRFAHSKTLSKREAGEIPFVMVDVPRIVKDRMTDEATPFHFTRIQFYKDAGLFFLAKFQNDEWEKKFTAVLRLLGDTGIGGDRSVGHGLFQVKLIDDIDICTPKEPSHFLTLSLYHPTVAEAKNINMEASYQIVERKGWIFSGNSKPLRRQAVRMFREGSVFPGKAETCGDTIIVLKKQPELNLHHDVFRFGQALVVPVHKGGQNHG